MAAERIRSRLYCPRCGLEEEFTVECSLLEREYALSSKKREKAEYTHRQKNPPCNGNILILPALPKNKNPAYP